MLKFSHAAEGDRGTLLKLTEATLIGTEAFTLCRLYEKIPEEAFFCGRTENGEIRCVIFNNGDEYTKIYGEEFPVLFRYSDKCIFTYGKDSVISEPVKELSGRELIEFYKLISQKNTLCYDDEKRYVARLRAVNRGFAKVFAVYEKEKMISVSAISAQNKEYCLIADVFTHPDFRGKGYAQKCINACIAYALSVNKTPFLFCEEGMRSYYEKLGFTYYGKM